MPFVRKIVFFRYFQLGFLLVFLINVSRCYGQTDYAGLTELELDAVVEYVKTHETFEPTGTTDATLGQIVGYSFQLTVSGNKEVFEALFGGVPDFYSVRDGNVAITEGQATQLLKEDLKQVIQQLDSEIPSFLMYTVDMKTGLIDAEFAMILTSDTKSLLLADPQWQRICLAIRTDSEDEDARRFDDCRIICPIPSPIVGSVSSYDACTDGLLFAYGLDFGDSVVPRNDDGSSGRIDLSTFFPYYDTLHESLFVNTNGLISFDGEVAQYTSDPFPLTLGNNAPLVAPFWADVDTNRGGTIYYRQMTRRDDPALAESMDNIIKDSSASRSNFELIWYFVATWDEVTFFGYSSSASSDELDYIANTFQAILVTDGRYAYTIFNYGDIQWTTGTASEGDSTGLGGTQAQVGCNAGDGVRSYSVPGSRTEDIVDIEYSSNVGLDGRYIYDIGGESVIGMDCGYGSEYDLSGSLILYPVFGSMLGGNSIEVQGACFDYSDDVMCRFIDETGPETTCEVYDERTVSCVVPMLLRIGRIHVFISKNGGTTYGFQGIYTSVSIDELTEDLAPTVRLRYASDVDSYQVVWPTDALLGNIYDIDVFVYDDDRNPTVLEEINIADNIVFFDSTSDDFVFTITDLTLSPTKHVGIIRVSQGDEEPDEENSFALSIWSNPFDLSIFTGLSVEKWCISWGNLESMKDPGLPSSEGELRCPCNLQMALFDRGRFTPSPRCSNAVRDSCADEDNIVHCVRSSVPSSVGHGLECCYDTGGALANIDDNVDAGYTHRYHYLGQEPYDRSGIVPYLSHFTHDILPYIRCCNDIDYCRAYFIPNRPSHDCIGYEPPQPARMSGDPHLQTLDGLAYTFNGHGEYVLIDALGGTFVMQGRTEPLPDTNSASINATRFTAMAAQYNNGTKVHIALNQIRGLVADVTEDNRWSRINFDDYPIWSDAGITILYTEGTNATAVSITVAFDFGLAFVVEAANEIMSIVVVGPTTMRGNCSGLLGNWNGDVTDDLQPPVGDYIASNSSIRDIHYDFGEKWRVDSEKSVFYYRIGTSYETYRNPDFEPWFEQPDNIDQNEVNAVCGDNFECIFDYQVTGSAEIAKVTKADVEKFEVIKEDVKPVVTCGFIATPHNGYKNGSVYTQGSTLDFGCNDGYNLTGSSFSIYCREDGSWSDSAPSCVDYSVTCGSVDAPQNGAKDGSVYTEGSIVYFTCNDGFSLNGSTSVNCKEGQWSDIVPSCVEEDTFDYYIVIYAAIGGVGLVFVISMICVCLCRTKRVPNPTGTDTLQTVSKGEQDYDECFHNPVYDTMPGEEGMTQQPWKQNVYT